MKKSLRYTAILFSGLFILLLILFRGAFKTYIFQDDFYLFSISNASDLRQFLNFFTPFKPYGFYRPVSIELFYFLANLINSLFVVRAGIFGLFFLGLVFLYKSLVVLTKNRRLSFLATTMYAVSFTHIYQLYWLATFQEVAVFTFAAFTVYAFLLRRSALSLIFFFLALLSREEAMVLPWLLIILWLAHRETRNRIPFRALAPYFLLTVPFAGLYVVNFAKVAVRTEYSPHLSPRLVGNNVVWYLLWGLGLPAFLPDFLPSIFCLPAAGFWAVVNNPVARGYLAFLSVYLFFFVIAVGLVRKKAATVGAVSLAAFLCFILPMSVIIHKWMVRLTIPLVFLVFFEAFVIYHSRKPLAVFLILLYFTYNILAVSVHEQASNYFNESEISKAVASIVYKNSGKIRNDGTIYFAENGAKSVNGWEGSQKLKLVLSDQYFLDYFLPGKRIRAVYSFENQMIPTGSFIIDANALLSNISGR